MSNLARFTRRDMFAVTAGGLVSASACRRTAQHAALDVTPAGEITTWPIATMADAIRRRRISSHELVSACLRQIERVNPRLNAVVRPNADALAQARRADDQVSRGGELGPLHGVPMTIKDSLDTAGVVSTAGTKGRASFVPRDDATVVARLKTAGAILLGKTNTPELTAAAETDNLVYGRTNNPYDVSRSPGGSSGGAAAIVASAGSPFDIGSDTGGSIRLPCGFCGIAGLKPNSRRVPLTGHIISYEIEIGYAFTALGPIARRVEDLRLLLPLLSGPDWKDPTVVPVPLRDAHAVDVTQLRVAFHSDNRLTPTSADVQESVRHAAMILGAAGAHVEEQLPPGLEFLTDPGPNDGAAQYHKVLQDAGTTQVSPLLSNLINGTAKVDSAADLELYLMRLERFRSGMLAFMQGFDAIVCPVFGQVAPPHGFSDKLEVPRGLSYTFLANYTGWPAATVRAGISSDGLPIGVQVIARPFREDVALALAEQLETALGGWQPPAIASS